MCALFKGRGCTLITSTVMFIDWAHVHALLTWCPCQCKWQLPHLHLGYLRHFLGTFCVGMKISLLAALTRSSQFWFRDKITMVQIRPKTASPINNISKTKRTQNKRCRREVVKALGRKVLSLSQVCPVRLGDVNKGHRYRGMEV